MERLRCAERWECHWVRVRAYVICLSVCCGRERGGGWGRGGEGGRRAHMSNARVKLHWPLDLMLPVVSTDRPDL
jgi:hypothetical protein